MRLTKSKLIAFACTLVLMLGAAPAGWAQDGKKYGFVNISQVIAESEQGKAEAKELESLGAEKEQELNARKQELEELAQQ